LAVVFDCATSSQFSAVMDAAQYDPSTKPTG
jgi:hypothetical protein